ncbi:MAG: protein kinase [Planctomycetes bacterium]|nr:protein kinase [Planctomycetota bacterium]
MEPVPEEVLAQPASERFGKFVRTRKLGAGGMGEVWKAWDTELRRWVALKFLKGGDDEEVERFRREAHMAGNLSHPHIAAIHEMESAYGRHYIAMQYVDGQTLKAAPRIDRRTSVRRVRDASRGVAYAHERGIVHRDLKPENLMLDDRGHVYVMDFGLARSVLGHRPVSGSIVGTPAYMAPEQAIGVGVDGRADVYSLGATLYELLTDRAPFRGATALEILRKVRDEDAMRPRAIRPEIEADLEAIVLKCLEKEPARRYPGAKALADDLDRWLQGNPVSAHFPSLSYRLRKRLAKRWALVGVGLAGAVAVGLVAALLIPPWLQEREARRRTERLREEERERARQREQDLKELGALWAQVLIEKQGLHMAGEDPRRVLGRIREVVSRVDDYVGRHPYEPHGYCVRARGSAYLGELEEAEKDLRRALELDGGFSPAAALLARVLLDRYVQHNYGIADALADRLRESQPLLEEASLWLARSGGDEWVATWGMAKTREDDVTATLCRAFRAMYCDRDHDGALKILRLADEREPSAEYSWWSGMWSRSPEERFRLVEQALKRMPHFAAAYLERGFWSLERRDYAAALKDFERALVLSPRSALVYVNRASARGGAGDLDGAIEDCTRAIEIDPRRAEAFLVRGSARLMKGDLDGGIADCTRVLEINARIAKAHEIRGGARLQRGQYDLAIDDFTRALNLGGPNALILFNRARARDCAKDVEGAIADYAWALAIAPPNWPFRAPAEEQLRRLRGKR